MLRTCLTILVLAVSAVGFSAEPGNDALDAIVGLLQEKDPEFRSLGLEQVRTEAKGTAATERFAALLPKLAPDARAALLGALADRGDAAARPAALEQVKSEEPAVREAALRALGMLGSPADVPLLVGFLASKSEGERKAVVAALGRIRSPEVNVAMAAEIKRAEPAVRIALIQVLAVRRALDQMPAILAAAQDGDPKVRAAALQAIGELGKPEQIAPLLTLLSSVTDEAQRREIERAILAITGRIADVKAQADPLLAYYEGLDEAKKAALLPTLARVGGPKVLKMVEAAIADSDPTRREAGMKALCNWPDSSVGPQLLELARTAAEPRHREMALAALIRVAPLPDKRPAVQKLQLLQAAMKLAPRLEDRKLVLKRAPAIRTIETLRWAAGYLDDPELGQESCATIVELAHHRGLREPNNAEFGKLLDRVIAMSKDAVIVERAKRYKVGQTYKRGEPAKE